MKKFTKVASAMALVVGVGAFASSAVADSNVIGKIYAKDKVSLTSGSYTQNISQSQVPYIAGDQIVTEGKNSQAVVVLGNTKLVVGHDTQMKVLTESPLKLELIQGGVRVDVTQDTPSFDLVSANSSLTVTPETAGSVVFASAQGEVVIVSNSGEFKVQDNHGVVADLSASKAFVAGEDAKVVDVQVLSGGLNWFWIVGGIVAGAVIINELDDDDDGSPI